MKVFANFALLFGGIGFAAYIFIIIAGYFGCCAGLTTLSYHKIVIAILLVSIVLYAICVYNNCCKLRQQK